jgi:hypothetical protein
VPHNASFLLLWLSSLSLLVSLCEGGDSSLFLCSYLVMKLFDLDLCQLEAISGGRTVYRIGGQNVKNSGSFIGSSRFTVNGGVSVGDFYDQRNYYA